jgi:glycosyltransferase involved in cell wall biosynthesis
MKKRPELFIGITTWNSELFLPACLDSIFENTKNTDVNITVLDNNSSDGTVEIAREFKVNILEKQCSQGDALNILLNISPAPFTLLMHSDVVLLNNNWLNLCTKKIDAQTILVSPEDIGCGPYSRPFGCDMPESSFLFANTVRLRQTRILQWRYWHGLPLPRKMVDFYGPHVTHNLPSIIRNKGYKWYPMSVHASDMLKKPIYVPNFTPSVWREDLGYLRYGLGNFYSIDGTITHYHNWYDRVNTKVSLDSQLTTGQNGSGFPLAYINSYSQSFLSDYYEKKVILPSTIPSTHVPKAL